MGLARIKRKERTGERIERGREDGWMDCGVGRRHSEEPQADSKIDQIIHRKKEKQSVGKDAKEVICKDLN